jgi:CHASE2 domain-containing sensor protein
VSSLLSFVDVRKFSRKKKIQFLINVSVGVVIAVFFHFLENTDWGESTINKAFDFVIRREAERSAATAANLTSQRNTRASDRIVFVEIDDGTYKKWGEPLLTPREKLADLVRMACDGGAKVIVLDVLLEDRDCCNPGSDAKLRSVLQEVTQKRLPVKVIFPVRIGHDGGFQKRNLCEDLVASNANFYFATANISATVTDRIIRYWVPFETARFGKSDSVLWNMSLLAPVLYEGKEGEMQKLASQIKNGAFHKTYHFKLHNSATVAISPDSEDIYRNRIRFLLIPKNALPYHPGGNLFDAAYGIDEAKHAAFKDKIVIIGNSSPDVGDIHPTPIGNLAGMFIVGNAINTILSGIQPSHPPLLVNLLIEAVIITMSGFLFLYFHSFLAQVLGSALLIVPLGVFGYWYFLYTGVFLNFIFAVVGMSFHRTVSNIEEIISRQGSAENRHREGGTK